MSKPIQKLDETARRLEWVRPRIGKALATTRAWAGLGYPTGGGNGRGSEMSNPTATIGADLADGRRKDDFAIAHANAIADIATIELATKRLERFVQTTDVVALTASSAPEGCALCTLVRDQGGALHEHGWQPIRERRIRPTEPQGAKVPMCSFHCEFIERYGIEPAPAIDLWHLEHLGSRIPYQLIRDHHPEEFSLAQSRQRGKNLGRHNLDLTVEVS